MPGRKGMQHYSDELKKQIRQEVSAGKSQNEVSREYGISRYTVQSWCGLRPETKLRQAAPLPKGRLRKEVRAKAKYAVIYRHREKYSVLVMCRFFSVSRSGYYSFVKNLNWPEKDAALASKIRNQQEKCFHTYGYHRMWQWLKNSKAICHNLKTECIYRHKPAAFSEANEIIDRYIL